jgi:AhpD family alkylhydroperoxidase
MRLPSYESGTRLDQRVFLKVTRLVGADVDDVGKSALRRPDFFGTPFLAFAHLVLRGPSAWSIGERELFAAVVSRANTCQFCLGTHGEIAAKEMGRDVLDRPRRREGEAAGCCSCGVRRRADARRAVDVCRRRRSRAGGGG